MLSIERTKELIGDPLMSDKEATEIRDGFHALVEVIFEQWQNDRTKKRDKDPS
jgi:hypothetical protein